MQKCLNFGALILVAALTYGTLARVALPYALYFKLAPWLGHPRMHTYALIEHVLVFATFGALLSFVFRGRIILLCGVLVFIPTLLEYVQTLTPDRHGTILDACEKVTGGLLGACVAYAATWCRRSISRERNSPGGQVP